MWILERHPVDSSYQKILIVLRPSPSPTRPGGIGGGVLELDFFTDVPLKKLRFMIINSDATMEKTTQMLEKVKTGKL